MLRRQRQGGEETIFVKDHGNTDLNRVQRKQGDREHKRLFSMSLQFRRIAPTEWKQLKAGSSVSNLLSA